MPEFNEIDREIGQFKASFDIRVSARCTADELEQFANDLAASLDAKPDRIFICYYLPGMLVGVGAWATSHFNPELSVQIMGEESADFVQHWPDVEEGAELVGSWIGQGITDETVVIFSLEGRHKLKRRFADGGQHEIDLKIIEAEPRSVFEDRENEQVQYVIDSFGKLSITDVAGIIKVFTPVPR